MKSNIKYISLLIGSLIVFYTLNNFIFAINYDFNKVDEYIYKDEKSNNVLKDCREVYDNLSNNQDKLNKILSITKIIKLSEYLLYKDKISPNIYYDLIKTIYKPKEVTKFKNKENFIYETTKYIDRKRKVDIIYTKYEVSNPIFYKKNGDQYSYVIVKEWSNGKYISLRYNFIKVKNNWYLNSSQVVNIT